MMMMINVLVAFIYILRNKVKQNIKISLKTWQSGLEYLQNQNALIEYSNIKEDVYKNIKEYNPGKKFNVLMAFHNMIADIITNKKLNQVVTELFLRGTKLNIFTAFIILTCFPVPKC